MLDADLGVSYDIQMSQTTTVQVTSVPQLALDRVRRECEGQTGVRPSDSAACRYAVVQFAHILDARSVATAKAIAAAVQPS